MNNLIRQIKLAFFAVLIFGLVSPFLVCGAFAQATTISAEVQQTQLEVGDTLVVAIKVSNAVDLYGLDVTLDWNKEVLAVIDATNNLGVESHPEGVLHESPAYPIEVLEETTSNSQYHLLATSTGPIQAFSGSGTIATIVFNVTDVGDAGLCLKAELSVRNAAGEVSLLTPSTRVDLVNVVIPEFPTVELVAGVTVASAFVIVVMFMLRKPKCLSSIRDSGRL